MSQHVNRIMLVDDDEITNFINEELIERMGVADKLVVCSDGQEALDHIAEVCLAQGEEFPKVIFLDLNMPRVDGLEFLRQFGGFPKNQAQNTSIALLTTSSRKEDFLNALSLSPNIKAFIEKPLDEKKISLFIAEHAPGSAS